ncbi:DUF6320 domain-containing protein [Leucobacter alluvii]|uniref:DUF6320 domain-containing protein n=1 Tax=Leucobacter alluvii TaxID=340321 RepID=A0ABN3B458_9MICO
MRRCEECAVTIEGTWATCPLCQTALIGDASPDPLPSVPLTFSKRRILKALFFASLAVILVSFVVQLFFARDLDGIGVWRSIWLGVTAMWLVVLMAVRKRRNVAKGTVYLVALIGLVCVYWDYLGGWQRWSLTYAVPIVCASAIIALLITVQLLRIDVAEHLVYSGLTVLLGLAPFVFLVFRWVNNPWASWSCIVVSLVALGDVQILRGREMRLELAKRFHL